MKSNFRLFSPKVLSTCVICCEEGWNLKKMRCCGQTVHVKCLRRWKLTLLQSSSGCPHCRAPMQLPPTDLRVALHEYMVEWKAVSYFIQLARNCFRFTLSFKVGFNAFITPEVKQIVLNVFYIKCFEGGKITLFN